MQLSTSTPVTTEPEGVHPTSPTNQVPAIRLRPGLLVTHVAITSALLLLTTAHILTPQPLRVEVDLAASAGTQVALYVNDLNRQPLIRPLVQGARQKYVFDDIVEDITMLRVDPTDAGGAAIDLHSIAVLGRGGIRKQFGPRDLAGWAMSALNVAEVDDQVLHLRTTSAIPIITATTSVPIDPQARQWTRWFPRINRPGAWWRVAVASLALLIVAATLDPARRLHLPLALGAVALVSGVVALQARLPDGPASAAVAVSRATFMGVSMRPTLVSTFALIIGSVAIGAAASLLHRGRDVGDKVSVAKVPLWSLVGGVLILTLVTSPDLRGWASFLSTRQFVPQWDEDTMLYWAYLTSQGKVALRDFWFPYAGGILFQLPFPTGYVLLWFHDALMLGVFFAAVARWRGSGMAALTTSLLVVGHGVGLLPAMNRYLLSFNVVLAYLSGNRDLSKLSARALFCLALAMAFLVDPSQVVYAAVPIACLIAAEACSLGRTEPSLPTWLARRLRADFGLAAAMLLTAFAVLALSGQLGGFLQMYSRLGDAVAYSAWPVGLAEFQATGDPRALFAVTCSAILLALGTYEYLAGGARRLYGEVLAGTALVSFMVLQKHFVRWMHESLFLTIAVGIMALCIGWPGRRRLPEYLVYGVVLGTTVAMLIVRPLAPWMLNFVSQSIPRLRADIDILGAGRPAWDSVNAARFALERFERHVAQRKVIDRLRAVAGPGGDVRVFSLTDDPVLYILAGQTSVWMSNLYDASPIYRQQRVVQWLRDQRPPFVVVNPDHLVMDEFQKAVRVPLVFSEVVSTYVPLEVVERLHIFRRRGPHEPLNLQYWRGILSGLVDVGRLASISSFGRADCSSTCGELLEISVQPGGSGKAIVPVTVDDQRFAIAFTQVPDETTYRVLLDRVWFWDAAKRAGLPHALGDTLPPGIRVQVRRVEVNPGTLY